MSFQRSKWLNVFLSYSTEDENLTIDLADFLKKFSINPILATRYRQPDEYISHKIAQLIMDSNCFVAILTQNSIDSQWVNQEMGFTYALQRVFELGGGSNPAIFYHYIPVYRLVDANVTNQTKGFFNAKEYILMDTQNLAYAKYLLLTSLRAFINRHETIIKEVEVVCMKCKFPYKTSLPSQIEIDEDISKNFVLATFCQNPNCRTQNNLNLQTFEVISA